MNIYDTLNQEIHQTNISEFSIVNLSFDGMLTIAGSSDTSYYHELEIYIRNPSYISLPSYFEYPTFRRATPQEKEELEKSTLFSNGIDGTLICIELDKEFNQPFEKHYIIAEEITYKFGLVYHYKRENLEEGERIAEWVK